MHMTVRYTTRSKQGVCDTLYPQEHRPGPHLVGQVTLVEGQQASSMEHNGCVGCAYAILQQRRSLDDANLHYSEQHGAQITAQHTSSLSTKVLCDHGKASRAVRLLWRLYVLCCIALQVNLLPAHQPLLPPSHATYGAGTAAQQRSAAAPSPSASAAPA